MPTAEAKQESAVSQDGLEPFGKALAFVKFRIRNLEQRKKNLEQLKKKVDDGLEHHLEREQVLAINKLPEVAFTLTYLEQMFGRLQQCGAEMTRLDKQRRQQSKLERAAADQRRFQRVLLIQDVLSNIDERVRADLLQGRGVPKLSEQNLQHLDEMFRLITPDRTNTRASLKVQMAEAGEHLMRLADYSQKKAPLSPATSYEEIARLVDQLAECGVFERRAADSTATVAQTVDPADSEDLTRTEGITDAVSASPLDDGKAQQDEQFVESPADVVQSELMVQSEPVENGYSCDQVDAHQQAIPPQPTTLVTDSADNNVATPPLPMANIQFLQNSELNMSDPSLVDPAVVCFTSSSSVVPAASSPLSYQQQQEVIVSQTFTNSNFSSPPASSQSAAAVTSWADEAEMGDWAAGVATPALAADIDASSTAVVRSDVWHEQQQNQSVCASSSGEWVNSARYNDDGRGGGRYRGSRAATQNGHYGGGRPYRGGGYGGRGRGGRRGGGGGSERGNRGGGAAHRGTRN